jgi:hypothetical protein
MNTWLSLIPEFLRSPETLWDEIRTGKMPQEPYSAWAF